MSRINIFNERKSVAVFTVLALILFWIYVLIPVTFIPGNTLSFYFSIVPWWGFPLLLILSFEISYILTSRIFLLLQKRKSSQGGVVNDAAFVVGGIVPAIFTCPILAVTVLSFILPVATIWILVGYQWHIVFVAVIIMAGLIYYRHTKRKVKIAGTMPPTTSAASLTTPP